MNDKTKKILGLGALCLTPLMCLTGCTANVEMNQSDVDTIIEGVKNYFEDEKANNKSEQELRDYIQDYLDNTALSSDEAIKSKMIQILETYAQKVVNLNSVRSQRVSSTIDILGNKTTTTSTFQQVIKNGTIKSLSEENSSVTGNTKTMYREISKIKSLPTESSTTESSETESETEEVMQYILKGYTIDTPTTGEPVLSKQEQTASKMTYLLGRNVSSAGLGFQDSGTFFDVFDTVFTIVDVDISKCGIQVKNDKTLFNLSYQDGGYYDVYLTIEIVDGLITKMDSIVRVIETQQKTIFTETYDYTPVDDIQFDTARFADITATE